MFFQEFISTKVDRFYQILKLNYGTCVHFREGIKLCLSCIYKRLKFSSTIASYVVTVSRIMTYVFHTLSSI